MKNFDTFDKIDLKEKERIQKVLRYINEKEPSFFNTNTKEGRENIDNVYDILNSEPVYTYSEFQKSIKVKYLDIFNTGVKSPTVTINGYNLTATNPVQIIQELCEVIAPNVESITVTNEEN